MSINSYILSKVNYMSLENLQFKSINLFELRDETLYNKLKTYSQREILLGIYLKDLLSFYQSYIAIYKIDPKKLREYISLIGDGYLGTDVEKQKKFLQEIDDFINYIIKNNMLNEFIYTDTQFSLYSIITTNSHNYISLFKFYDETFNTEIIIGNLLEIPQITQSQLFNLTLPS